jgi:hypothetical protein
MRPHLIPPLLLSLIAAPALAVTPLYDGFESGLGPPTWTTSAAANSQLAALPTFVHEGSLAVNAVEQSTGTFNLAVARTPQTGTGTLYAQFFLRTLLANVEAASATYGVFEVRSNTGGGDTGSFAAFSVTRSQLTYRLQLAGRGGGSALTSSGNVNLGAYHRVDLVLTGVGTAQGARTFFLDGVQEGSSAGLNWTGASYSEVALGILRTSTSDDQGFAFDEVRISPTPLAASLRLSAPAGPYQRGQCLPVALEVRNQLGASMPAPVDVAATLTVTAGSASLFSDPGCTTTITTATVTSGSLSSLLYVRPDSVADVGLTASHPIYLTSPVLTLTPVVEPPAQLVFTQQPASATAGQSLPAFQVTLRTAGGATASASSAPVTVELVDGTAGAMLSGVRAVNAVNGVANFGAVAIDKVGTGYRLRATSPGLPEALSAPFNVTPGPPDRLVFSQPPAGGIRGVAMPKVQVGFRDVGGNVTPGPAVQVTLVLEPHASGARLSGTLTATAGAIDAEYIDLALDVPGGGFVLRASASGLQDALSAPFNISAGPPSQLAFVRQPQSALAAQSLGMVEVQAQDVERNPAAAEGTAVTLVLEPGEALPGSAQRSINGGSARFSDLSVARAGRYVLRASAPGLIDAVSAPFDIAVGPPAGLRFSKQPTVGFVSLPLSPVEVELIDAGGNRVEGSVEVTLSLDPAPHRLLGLSTWTLTEGALRVVDLEVSEAGPAYVLHARSTGLAEAASAPFEVKGADEIVPLQLDLGCGCGRGELGPLALLMIAWAVRRRGASAHTR